MLVVQFDALLAIQEPHLKKKTTNFHELIDPEQQVAVCLRWGHTQNNPLNILGGCAKMQKIKTVPKKIMMDENFRVTAYFFQTCVNFG